MTNPIQDFILMVAVAIAFVLMFMATASYHNRPGGYCEQVRTNNAERMEYVDYQIFCK